ncbi:LysR family transcriptional regulator [Amorphus sp. 3PC139-8]|uniref:LysR family transcriptional regulator n=1 Tax=Amorphus sp. 3PC139-8 TaxID=2735676 RepID=UPI00345DB870
MNWNVDDVPIFVAVVEANGFTAAADALGMPKSTVSQAVRRLEDGLGLRLLDRNSRNLRITSEGETFYRQALLILEQVREADATMAGLTAVPSGRLVAALPLALCQEIVAPQLAAFRNAYPAIELELIITSRGIDILRDQVDIAVVVGPQSDSDLISRTLYSGRLVWVASPNYLAANRLGDSPANLVAHIQVCETRYGLKRMPVHYGGEAADIDLSHGVTHVNDPLSVRQAVLNGAGVSFLPELYCRRQIANGSLVEVAKPVSFDLSASVLSVVYPSRRLMSPKARAFIDFLNEICRV